MKTKAVTVGNRTFNLVEVDAEKQFELYEIIASRILHQCTMAMTEDVNADVVKGVLMSSERGFTSDVAALALANTRESQSGVQVSVKDFQGEIDGYYSLVAEGVELNLGSFFTSLKSQISSLKESLRKAKEKEESRL